jgi:hypothetical protein
MFLYDLTTVTRLLGPIMKILVYNTEYQYALSRKQIEIIKETLPKEFFSPIHEFHITTGSPGQERFEFDYKTKTACFEYKISQKTPEIMEDAVKTLLVGLCRIKAKVKFGHFIKRNEIIDYLLFIDKWIPICLNAITK